MPGPFLPTSIANAAKKRLADVGRRIPLPDLPDLDVPNPFEAAGSVAKEYGGALFSGVKYPLNNFAFSPYDKGWGDIVEQSADQSAVGRTAFDAIDIATAPATVGSAFLGPAETAGFKTLPRIARWPLNVAAPASKSANFGTRLAAETAIGTAGSVAGQETAERTDNPFLIGAAGLGAGVLAGGLIGGVRSADEATRTTALRKAAGPGESSTLGRLAREADPESPGVFAPSTLRPIIGGADDNTVEDAGKSAARKFAAWSNAEGKIRKSGKADLEVSRGRANQFNKVDEAIYEAARQNKPGLGAASASAKVGRLRTTIGEIDPISPEEWDAIDTDLTRKIAAKEGRGSPDALVLSRAVRKGKAVQEWQANGRVGPTPEGLFDSERKVLAEYGYGDLVNGVDDAVGTFGGGRRPPKARPTAFAGGGGKATPPPQSAATRVADRARNEAAKAARADEAARRAALSEKQSALEDALNKAGEVRRLAGERLADQAGKPAENVIPGVRKRAASADAETADRMLGEAMRKAPKAREFIGQWAADNRKLLDGVTGDPESVSNTIRSAVEGSFSDPFLTQATIRRNILRDQLTRGALPDPDDAKAVADLLFERELKIRYPKGVPDEVRQSLKKGQAVPYEQSMEALDIFKQRAQNTQFGLLDFAIGGQQELNALRRNPLQIVAGGINRTFTALNLPHINVLDGTELNRQAQFALDGLAGRMTRSGLTEQYEEVGSLLSYGGKVGRALDKRLAPAVEKLTDIQFGAVLGNTRELDHEGNLVLLKLLGRDITDPLVRKQSAQMANHATSAAQRALTKSRAKMEQRLLISPMMLRARVENITDAAKLITPKASVEQRMMAATAIIGTVGTTLLMGKALQEAIGAPGSEQVVDPSLPGFGTVTTKYKNGRGQNIIVDYIPQDAVDRAFARALRAISESDEPGLGKAIATPLISSASILGRVPLEITRTGYQPGQGYRFGDLPGGAGNIASRMAPVPPVAQSILGEGTGPRQTALEVLGGSSYPESATGALSRATGAKFSDLTPSEKDAALQQNPDIAARRSQETIARGGEFGQYESEKLKYAAQQANADKSLADPQEWKKDYQERQQRLFGAREGILGKSEDDLTTPWGRYYAEVKQATGPDGRVDWDAVDAYRAGLDESENASIDQETGLGGTSRVKEYRQTGRELDKAGYFDLYDRVWARMAPKLGLEEYKTGREFEQAIDARVRERLVQRGITTRTDQDILMGKILDGIEPLKAYRSVANDVQEAWIKQNAGLARKAVEVGYIDPASLRNAERGAVISAGRTP